ncbi:hypothetical protein [Bacillus sp. MUM 13]|uniref:hypothetical protein n=1 Tax=Bacillus sp. MUM 13 TaxID=1678001 RepID=UPI0008F5DC71|nr:hypothetical protein [Bacillus sp. MUM 13]OIK11505.1 hypothetical protein BIV59_11785 [Bacillus sp. MUM 13]
MKNYVVFLFQLIVWSGYTVVEWLSVDDKLLFKILMFLIFSYLAIYVGNSILKSNKKTILITGISLFFYGAVQILLKIVIPYS